MFAVSDGWSEARGPAAGPNSARAPLALLHLRPAVRAERPTKRWARRPRRGVGTGSPARRQATSLNKTHPRYLLVAYRWHPLSGQRVAVLWATQCHGRAYAVCRLPDGTRHPLPAWMLDEQSCSLHSTGEPTVGLEALCELRQLLDGLGGSDLCHGSGIDLPQEESLGAKTDSSASASPRPLGYGATDGNERLDVGASCAGGRSSELCHSASRASAARRCSASERRRGR